MRKPAVSGYFYPKNKEDLLRMMNAFSSDSKQPQAIDNLIGIVVPHAGYEYSGKTAMDSYSLLKNSKIRNFVIIGPNHFGFPEFASIYEEGTWETPLGEAVINKKIADKILKNSKYVTSDQDAHSNEHSVEVQLPFLQYLFGEDFTFVPLILGNQSKLVAEDLSNSLEKIEDDFILIASSDLTHYEPRERAAEKDRKLTSSITSLDVDKFYFTLKEISATACGFGAIATLMSLTRKRKGKLELISYSTSGDTTKDYGSVVGYASMVGYSERLQ